MSDIYLTTGSLQSDNLTENKSSELETSLNQPILQEPSHACDEMS
jgi:hypothetical protein